METDDVAGLQESNSNVEVYWEISLPGRYHNCSLCTDLIYWQRSKLQQMGPKYYYIEHGKMFFIFPLIILLLRFVMYAMYCTFSVALDFFLFRFILSLGEPLLVENHGVLIIMAAMVGRIVPTTSFRWRKGNWSFLPDRTHWIYMTQVPAYQQQKSVIDWFSHGVRDRIRIAATSIGLFIRSLPNDVTGNFWDQFWRIARWKR